MSSEVGALVDKMIADAENKIRTDLNNISAKVKRDFVEKAKEAVSSYYANYSPKIYQRTNNLRNNVIDDDLTFSILNGNGYGAAVQFNSNNMSDYNMGNKDVVVSNFMYGIHGRRNIAVDGNPAIDLMKQFQDGYKATLDGYFIGLGYTVR